uniref:Serpin domain-containing protein n=1 Tax=Globodera rostochiensis TaxID=31243 RepID=A0A914IDR1_GLORO
MQFSVLFVVLMMLFATFYIGVEPFARQAALNNLGGGDDVPDASGASAAQPGQQPEYNAEELCRPIEGTLFHAQCLLSEVVKQKGFIPKHLRPPWLDSKLFEDNELPPDKATSDGCYACYKGTKASNGVNPGEEYCACTYKKQALNVKFEKIFGTFDFGDTMCIQDFHKMTLMPKCGSDYYEHVKHCAMVHFYDNDPDKEPRNTEHKRTLVLLDGCIITAGSSHKNCTAKVNIAFEQQPKSSFFYGTCDAEMKTVFESTIEVKASFAGASEKLADANKVTNATTSSSFAFPVEFKHRICKGLFGSTDADDAFKNITIAISGDCGTKSFKLPTLEFDKGRVQEMRGLQLDLRRGNAVVQWRDALGGYAFAKKARLLWQPSELKSLNAYGLVNVALMYPNVDLNSVGQAEFSMDLLKAVYRNRAEAIALAMAYAGARGQTAAEFGTVLTGASKHSSGSTLHISFGKFLQEIASNQINEALKRNNLQSDGPPPEFKLKIANRIYLAKTFNVLDEFKLVINTHYGGNFESIDFEQNVAAAEKINAFVEDATNGKIKDLVKSDDFNFQTKLVLVNAIHFKANWLRPFSNQMTERLTFFIANGQESKLDMMQMQQQFIYAEENNFKMLGMPYVGEKAHLFILLPNANDGLEYLLNELKGAKLMELIENSATTEVKVILPKFKIESSHQMGDVLASLGIKRAFERNADFSGISNTTLPLHINKVIQKAMISVDENGTEAAAVTAVFLLSPISPADDVVPPPPPTFRADHPFAFFLIYTQKQHVMFSGVFMGEQ